jgi:hypothetical protein
MAARCFFAVVSSIGVPAAATQVEGAENPMRMVEGGRTVGIVVNTLGETSVGDMYHYDYDYDYDYGLGSADYYSADYGLGGAGGNSSATAAPRAPQAGPRESSATAAPRDSSTEGPKAGPRKPTASPREEPFQAKMVSDSAQHAVPRSKWVDSYCFCSGTREEWVKLQKSCTCQWAFACKGSYCGNPKYSAKCSTDPHMCAINAGSVSLPDKKGR